MKYNGENLQEVLEAHKRWIDEEDGWSENDRADFTGANLAGTNLAGANLYGASLYRAYLYEANLRAANLTGANLYEAVLKGANLYGADLSRANLRGADLMEANLRGADLSGARLIAANLYGADLKGANLSRANLRGATDIPFIPMACPDTGAFIGWKKCIITNTHRTSPRYGIAKLLIPEDADPSSATGRKCRASCAIVLEIQTLGGEVIADAQSDSDIVALSRYDKSFEYIPGETVRPREPFDADRWNECGSGIHFFINRQEAVDYMT